MSVCLSVNMLKQVFFGTLLFQQARVAALASVITFKLLFLIIVYHCIDSKQIVWPPEL